MKSESGALSNSVSPRDFIEAVLGACFAVLALAARPAHPAPTFTVNSPADVIAAAPLDSGPCETATGNGVCTLRAAIMKANHSPGGGATIRFGLPGVVTGLITLHDPDGGINEFVDDFFLTASMNIIGNGAGNTLIDGNGSFTNRRVLRVEPDALRGAALVAGVVDPLGSRSTAADIEPYIQSLMP